MKSVNSLINTIKNRISNNDSVKKIEEATNKILHKEDKEVSCCINTDNKNTEKIEELNKIQIVQPSSSSIFNRSDDIYHLFRPQDNINSYDSSLIMRNVDKCKGTNENLKNSKRIQLYKNKGDISNFNTTIRTNLNKFKIDLSKDLRYKFLNKYSAEDDFNFDIYIFPPPEDAIRGFKKEINLHDSNVTQYYYTNNLNPDSITVKQERKNLMFYTRWIGYYESNKGLLDKGWFWPYDRYEELQYDVTTGNINRIQVDIIRLNKENSWTRSLVKTTDVNKMIDFLKKYGCSDFITEAVDRHPEYTSIMCCPNGNYFCS